MTPDGMMRTDVMQRQGLQALTASLPGGLVMVEVGCYKGESARIFLDSGKVLRLYCVDPWKDGYDPNDDAGNTQAMHQVEAVFDATVGKDTRLQKIKAMSEAAAETFADESLDFVYIDACHQYDAVKSDILAWKSKVRPGGLIGGHDFGVWPGVARAVRELLGEPTTFMDSSWVVRL